MIRVSEAISVVCEALNIGEEKLAEDLGVTYETINHWKRGKKPIDIESLEKLYSYAYRKGIKFNKIYEQLHKEEYSDSQNIVLFHGAKKSFSLPIDFSSNSKNRNDFGVGFYLGETFEQAANYISYLDVPYVYCFKLNLTDLKIYKFGVNTEWMLAIAYFRGWMSDFRECKCLQNTLKKIKSSDVIIAPIADNRMFDLIAEFIEGNITDEQCKHSLAATNLGFQYVLKTDKAVEQVSFIEKMFVCKKEKEECIEKRASLTNDGIQKVKMARISYKGKGKYFEELLK